MATAEPQMSPQWTGDPQEETRFAPFLRLGDQTGSRVIWWMEPDLSGMCDLLVTRELATDAPIRVRPGQRLALLGHELSVSGRPGGARL